MSQSVAVKYFPHLILLVSCMLLTLIPPPDASAERVVRLGINDYQPLVFHDKSGVLQGFFVDIINDVAKRESWKVEYIPGTFQESIQRLKSGEIDLVAGLSKTDDRMVWYDFCAEPVVSTWAQIYTRDKTRIHTILDLKGKRIAYLRGDVMANHFWILAKQFGINSVYLGMDTVDQLFEAVKSGKADACICERIGGEVYKAQYSLVKSPILYFPSSLYFTVPKGKNADLLEALDWYLRAEKADPLSQYNSMVRHWLEEESQPRMPEYLVWTLRISLAALLLFGLAAGLLGIHNRRLAHMVRERTVELSTVNREMRAILDNASSLIGLLKPDGTLVTANRAAMEFVSVTVEDVEGKLFWETPWWNHTPESQARMRDAVLSAARGNRERYETEIVSPESGLHYIDVSITPILDDSGNVVLLVPEGYDITERKRAAEALRKSEEKFSKAFRASPAAFCITELDSGLLMEANDAFGRLFEAPREEMVGRTVMELGMWDDPYDRIHLTQLLEADGMVHDREYRFRTKTGDLIICRYSAERIDLGGEPCIISVLIDITARKRIEEALKENEEKFRLLFYGARDPIFLLDKEGRILDCNDSALRILGVSSREEMLDSSPSLFSPEYQPDGQMSSVKAEIFREQAFREGSAHFEWIHRRRDRNDFVVDVSLTDILIGGRMMEFAHWHDITERKRAQEALLSEKERLAVTLRSIGDGVITTDREGRIALMNRVAERLTGWTQGEAAGRPLDEVFYIVSERTRERLPNPALRVLETGGVIELSPETILLARNGRELAIADSGAPIRDAESAVVGMVIVFRDVTEKRKMEDEAQRMEKLEAVGILAGGIAHDFNNILTGIMGALSLARMLIEPGHQAEEMLREAEEQSLRARDLTGQLLTFSRGGDPVRVAASVEATVRETISFVLRGSPVKGNFRFPADLHAARVDLNQIGRVIHNLALNALQAMPEGGVLEVSAENITIGKKSSIPLAPGEYIQLSVRDTGTGIPPEHLSRIFDPYFTTKNTGSGLGLAATYSIVKHHEGYITVDSGLGQGTVFHVYLPAVDAPAELTENTTGVLRGHGRVLVMDDEESVRRVVTKMAELLGYTMESVDDGLQAVERYREAAERGERFDAVIMDMTVPGGMGGAEASALIREFDPEARIIVSSGYSTSPVMGNYTSHGFSGVLRKPYRMEEVGAALREAMEKPETETGNGA